MKENRLVSTIIPTYNRPNLLKRTIKSVLNQTYRNIEAVVVDDCSLKGNSKKNQDIIKSLNSNKIIYIRNEKNMGPNYSRNEGIRNANGAFIALLDDDDYFLPKKIEKQMKAMSKYPNVGLVICSILDHRMGMTHIRGAIDPITHKGLLKSYNLSSGCTYLIRREAIKKIGEFDEALPSAQEYDLALRLSNYYEIKFIPDVLVVANPSPNQISENWNKKIRGIIMLYQKYHREYWSLGLMGCILNHLKTVALFALFFSGYIFGNRIYKIIVPLKGAYEKL